MKVLLSILVLFGFLSVAWAQDTPFKNTDDTAPIATFTQMVLRIEKPNTTDVIYINNEGELEYRHNFKKEKDNLEIIKASIIKTTISQEEMQKLLEVFAKAKLESLPESIGNTHKQAASADLPSVLGALQIFNKKGEAPDPSDPIRAKRCVIESIDSLDKWEEQLRPLIKFLQDLEKRLIEKATED